MMVLRFVLLICLIISIVLAANSSSHVEHFYRKSKAGISYSVSSIEIQPETTFDSDLVGTIEVNIQHCEDTAGKIDIRENHVLIYPEYGITSSKTFNDRDLARNLSQYIPRPGQLEVPCYVNLPNATHKMLKRMSCLAIEHQVYIVTHFIEREDCNDCDVDNLKLYSTAVAFNKLGLVVAKYRKMQMYDETALDSASSVEVATFTTDFDVTFGIVMSFDLMFVSPATLLTNVLNITEILVPYALPGVLPFLTPIQIQYGWSFVSNVNMIPGCYLRPSEGYSGCGMFFGDGNGYTVGIVYEDNYIYSSSTIYVNKIERQVEEKSSNKTNYLDLEYNRENLTDYVSVTLEKNNEQREISACHNTLCCNLTYTMFEYPEEDINYKLIVFDGIKHHPNNGRSWSSQTCGLVACTAGFEGNIACTDMPEFESYTNFTVFNNLKLTGNFNSSHVFPSSMLSNFFPFDDIELVKEEDIGNNKFNVHLSVPKSTRGVKNIHTFGLVSHDLEAFYVPVKDSSSSLYSNVFIILFSLCTYLFCR